MHEFCKNLFDGIWESNYDLEDLDTTGFSETQLRLVQVAYNTRYAIRAYTEGRL
jgi:hypothetical protein